MKPSSNFKKKFINLIGCLFSLGIAFGGLFLVQYRLSEETAALLSGEGTVTIARAADEDKENPESSPSTSITLSEDALLQAVHDLEDQSNAIPHEPLSGQLTMPQAVECAKTWLEDSFLPIFPTLDFSLQESRVDCYLWTTQETGAAGQDPLFSYWTVSLSIQDTAAVLILNASTGQILDASVLFCSADGYPDTDMLLSVLCDFTESFGLTDSFSYSLLINENDREEHSGQTLYQSVGSQGLLAALEPGNIIVGKPDDQEYAEFIRIHLYLTLKAVPR